VDTYLRELFDAASEGGPASLSLVALGGYGRGSLAPRSDVDLMLLHGSREDGLVRRVAERLFYPLWDAGFAVGNAVRTVRDCVEVAAQRLDAATALVDARLLAGDGDLFATMHEGLVTRIRRDADGFLRKLRVSTSERSARFGSVSHLLEPDLKEGSGGLRDIHALGWTAWATIGTGDLAALEHLRASERALIQGAEEFLTRLRSAIHLETGKRTDRLLLEAQPVLAGALGFEDEPNLPAVDALMRATFEHARAVEHVLASLWGRTAEQGAGARPERVEHSPEGIMRLFAEAASSGRPVPGHLLDEIDQAELPDKVRWTTALRDDFLLVLREGQNGIAALEAMDRVGLLVRFLPEWDDVRCRPQRDPFHRYTVDVHLLETLAAAARLVADPPQDDPMAQRAASAVQDRDGLLLGALLHDIGKTGAGGHVDVGTRLVDVILERLGVDRSTADLARFLVEHHLLLSDTATRRDLGDEDLVLGVAARVGRPDRLAALYILTMADAAATGPHAWTPWRATLVRELVAKVEHLLERGAMGTQAVARLSHRSEAIRTALRSEQPVLVDRFLERMPPGYLMTVEPDRAAEHYRLIAPPLAALEVRTLAGAGSRPGTHALTVVARDRPGLLSRIAGSLALSGLSILTAQVFTTEDGIALDLFEVEGAFHGQVDEERWRTFRSTLRRAVEGRLSLDYRVREKRAYYKAPRPDIPVRVTVDDEASDFFTVIEVGAPDRMGLLFDVTRALADLDLDVHFAKVATYGGRVVDAFYVRDALGRKVEDQEHVREIQRAITARLTD
jgi:[protein-PII] uridylyltransferase